MWDHQICAFNCQAGHQTSDVIKCRLCHLNCSYSIPHSDPNLRLPHLMSALQVTISQLSGESCVSLQECSETVKRKKNKTKTNLCILTTDLPTERWGAGLISDSCFPTMHFVCCTYLTSSERPEHWMKEEACRNSVHCNNTEFIHRAFCIFLFVSGLLWH